MSDDNASRAADALELALARQIAKRIEAFEERISKHSSELRDLHMTLAKHGALEAQITSMRQDYEDRLRRLESWRDTQTGRLAAYTAIISTAVAIFVGLLMKFWTTH